MTVDDRIAGFDALYRDDDDPWHTESRWYEARRRALLLASLPARRFGDAFEAGCGNGNVTELLAARCDRLLASDGSEEAVRLTRRLTDRFPNVEVRLQRLPRDWPRRSFDLSVISELVYFLDDREISELAASAAESAGATGLVVACHWRDDIAGFGHRGDEAHRTFEHALALPKLFEYADDDFILSGWSRSAASVATVEGLRTASC